MTRQFDVHWSRFLDGLPGPSYFVNLQSDHLSPSPTVVVAPLWPATGRTSPSPVSVRVRFQGRDYCLVLTDLAYVRVSSLGSVAGNVAAERDRIVRSLDLLFTGI